MYEVMKYVHEHIRERMPLECVAKHFGYSKWYFCTLFKQFTGRSFVEYTKHFRLQLAAAEILDGKKSTDVAISYGYDTLGGFNKAFLSEFGCLPRELKRKNKLYHIQYKERRDNMMDLSDRCALLREERVNRRSAEKKICAQRKILFSEGVRLCPENAGNELLMAHGLAHVMDRSPAFIGDGELIVGYNYGDSSYGEFYDPAQDPERDLILKENLISPEQAAEYFRTRDAVENRFQCADAPKLTKQDMELTEEWAAIGKCIADNHSVIGYQEVLTLGFSGILEKVKKYEAVNGPSELYTAMKLLCQSACRFGEKYAAEARRLSLTAGLTEARRTELAAIAEVCSRVPAQPATNLWEAIQSLWFAHIFNTWEDYTNANSLGRLDQILYPYYQKDIEQGILTKEEAFELICCLWIKLYRDYDVQQSCVGGCHADGSPAVNELSYLMLDATEKLDFVRCLSVRFSPDCDKAFLRRALEVVGHLQKGVPFFFNDSVMIPALVSKGISLEDARDYTQIGCVETVIPEKSNPHAVTGEINMLKALEYTLQNGRSMVNSSYFPGIETGSTDSFTTYDSLKKAVYQQIEHLLDNACKKVALYTKAAETDSVKPYKSLLTQGCMETNRDFNNHGATYDYYQIMLGGIPNLADSLIAMKHLIYQDKKYTLTELIRQLEQNYPDEAVRQDFLNKAPKFGNDIDEVDFTAAELTEFACDCLDNLSEKYGLSFHAQPFTYLWMIDQGHMTAASPDGRRKGENIAYSVSPMQGRDFNGFTALLNSLSKLPTKRAPGTTSAIVEVDPKLFTDSNIGLFTDMILTAAENGLCNLQFNVVDAETLLDAQKHPEKYNNLAVRVSGFSQKFNLLDKELQDHIIGRTKHKCL